jgi:formylglycine-generating enzyme required for sulfatase activity
VRAGAALFLASVTSACAQNDQSEIVPAIGLEWVSLGGGSFAQGNPSATEKMSNETPVHTVTVQDFAILRTEVTVAQYAACVAAGTCSEPDVGARGNWEVPARDDHPINYVDWHQAVAFCRWVEGRLPTESEWEYAARNRGEALYPWGDGAATCDCAVMQDESGIGCGRGTTWPVCSKPDGNAASGLCDMIGNLWEWTLDWYHDSYVGAPIDGTARIEPRGQTRVMRGGALSYDAFWNRATARDSHGDPSYRVFTLGFRCVRGQDVAGDYDAPIDIADADADAGGEANDCDERECDFACQAQACANSDGNTHVDCTCDSRYCVPDEQGVELAGLTALTCTTADCDPSSPGTCPPGTACKVIPPFVIQMMADKGVIMPATICGAN